MESSGIHCDIILTIMNPSEKRSLGKWRKWRASGAVGSYPDSATRRGSVVLDVLSFDGPRNINRAFLVFERASDFRGNKLVVVSEPRGDYVKGQVIEGQIKGAQL